MDPSESEAAVDAFLERYWQDRDRGDVKSLADYLAMFPGADVAIAREFVELQGLSSMGMAEALLDPASVLAEVTRHERHVVARAEVGKQAPFLDHVAHPAPQLEGVVVADDLAVEAHLARVWSHETDHHARFST